MKSTTAPAAAAIARVVMVRPDYEPIVTSIICTSFNACELAQKAADQFSGWSIASVHWNR